MEEKSRVDLMQENGDLSQRVEPFTRSEDQGVRVGRAQGWLCQIVAIQRIIQIIQPVLPV